MKAVLGERDDSTAGLWRGSLRGREGTKGDIQREASGLINSIRRPSVYACEGSGMDVAGSPSQSPEWEKIDIGEAFNRRRIQPHDQLRAPRDSHLLQISRHSSRPRVTSNTLLTDSSY